MLLSLHAFERRQVRPFSTQPQLLRPQLWKQAWHMLLEYCFIPGLAFCTSASGTLKLAGLMQVMNGGAYVAALLRLTHHPSEAVIRRALKLVTTSLAKLNYKVSLLAN